MKVKENLIEGYPDNTLHGLRQLTHAEVAAILNSIVEESFFEFFTS